MGKVDLSEHSTGASRSDRHGGGGPLADTIGGEDDGFIEGGRVEGTRCVAVMVLGEPDPVAEVFDVFEFRQGPDEGPLLEELLPGPDGHGAAEGVESPGRMRDEGFEKPFEFEERLVVEGDPVDVGQAKATEVENGSDRGRGKGGIVLDSRESFLLDGADDLTIDD